MHNGNEVKTKKIGIENVEPGSGQGFKKFIYTAAIAVVFLAACGAHGTQVKNPGVAGSFYPAEPDMLNTQLNGYFSRVKNLPQIKGKVLGVLAPHAGYEFSAQTAAYSFSVIDDTYDDIIVIGTAHYSPVYGLNTCLYDRFRVPTGEAQCDTQAIKKLIEKSGVFKEVKDAFAQEHSVEVELPFLLKKVKAFKIIPIVVSDISLQDAKSAADAVYDVLKDKKVLVVISSDLSHYPPADIAVKSDRECLSAVLTLDTQKIEETADDLVIKYTQQNEVTAACGEKAIITGIEIMKKFGLDKAVLLHTANSSDVPPADKTRVVGYGAVAFVDSSAVSGAQDNALDINLTKEQKIKMLKIVRESISTCIKDRKLMENNDKDPVFDKNYGVFVTLNKDNQLRGCVGLIEPVKALRQGLVEMSCAAALQDTRFTPVSLDEMKNIEVEISILSPPKKIKSVDEIVLGKHGVIVKEGYNTGVFLPQVATETGWSKDEFLSELCQQKAGLPRDAWKKDKNLEMYIFTAYVFSEKDVK